MSLFDDAKAALEDLKTAAQSVVATADRIVEHLRGQEAASVDPTPAGADAPGEAVSSVPNDGADTTSTTETVDPTQGQSEPSSPENSPTDSEPSADESPTDNTEHAQLHG